MGSALRDFVSWSIRAAGLVAALTSGAPVAAEPLVLDGGGYPTSSENVLDASDVAPGPLVVYVRNQGCGTAFPCAAPGRPTQALAVDGFDAYVLGVFEGSRLTLDGANLTRSGTSPWAAPPEATAQGGGTLDVRSGDFDGWLTVIDSARAVVRGGHFLLGGLVRDTGTLELLGGRIDGTVSALDHSDLFLEGGTLGAVVTQTGARLLMSGGTVTGPVSVASSPEWDGEPRYNMIRGGSIGGHLHAARDVWWMGGQIAGPLLTYASIYVMGSDFAWNGVPVPPGVDLPRVSGTLTGRWASGEPFEVGVLHGADCVGIADTRGCDGSVLPSLPTECSDGVDNDGDGFADHPEDPGCLTPIDPFELAPYPWVECDNGLDDDSDGLIDYPDDPGCIGPGSHDESPSCSDGSDNDLDELEDMDDPDCFAVWADSEGLPAVGCGLGPELALLLAPLLAARRRRR